MTDINRCDRQTTGRVCGEDAGWAQWWVHLPGPGAMPALQGHTDTAGQQPRGADITAPLQTQGPRPRLELDPTGPTQLVADT